MAVDHVEERVDAVLPYVTNVQIGDRTNSAFVESLRIRNFDVCIPDCQCAQSGYPCDLGHQRRGGLPDDQKPRIFDMFYTGANKIADSRRSLGLGLSLCKTIVTAHKGTVRVADRYPRGTVFTFTLPAGEVDLHE